MHIKVDNNKVFVDGEEIKRSKDMKPKCIVRIIDRTESFIESLFSDLVTFSFLAFCIWLSKGSTWWTFVTGFMFIMGTATKLSYIMGTRNKDFKTKEELIQWADSLDWGSKTNNK